MKTYQASKPAWLYDRRLPPALAVLAAAVSLVALAPRFFETFSVLPSYNEGWLALWVASWRDGAPMYPSTTEFFVANYPPGAPVVYALFERLFGDVVGPGRGLSWFLLLIICSQMAWIVRQLGQSSGAATVTAATTFATFAVWFNGSLGAAEPQLLGHVLILLGLVVLIRRMDSRAALFITALLFIAAGMVKQNLIGFPIGVTLWLFVTVRPLFYRWVIGSALAIALVLLGLYATIGSDFLWPNVLLGRRYSIVGFVNNLRILSVLIVPLVALAIFWRPHNRAQTLLTCCAVGTAFELALTAPAIGTAFNVGYDFALCLLLMFGVIVGELINRERLAASVLLFAFAVRVVVAIIPRVAELSADLQAGKGAARDLSYRNVISTLASIEGPAACFHPGLCYRAGKRTRVDASMGPVGFFSPPRDLATLQTRIDKREFAAVEMIAQVATLLDLSGYRVARESDGVTDCIIYVPKTFAR